MSQVTDPALPDMGVMGPDPCAIPMAILTPAREQALEKAQEAAPAIGAPPGSSRTPTGGLKVGRLFIQWFNVLLEGGTASIVFSRCPRVFKVSGTSQP